MIHWLYLIPTFIAGILTGYWLIYELTKIASRVYAAIEEGSKNISF